MEKSTSCSLASLISFERKARSSDTDIKVASTTVPLSNFIPVFKSSIFPSESVNSILAKLAWFSLIVADFSLLKKSFPSIDETWVAELDLHLPME